MSENTNVTTAANTVKPTRREKLLTQYQAKQTKQLALVEELNELANEINNIDALASVGVGSEVLITVGRGEESKEVLATVIGVKEEEDGSKVFKATYGTGFDADIAVVKAGRVKLPPVAEVAEEVPAAE